jgi:hypothetical protein
MWRSLLTKRVNRLETSKRLIVVKVSALKGRFSGEQSPILDNPVVIVAIYLRRWPYISGGGHISPEVAYPRGTHLYCIRRSTTYESVMYLSGIFKPNMYKYCATYIKGVASRPLTRFLLQLQCHPNESPNYQSPSALYPIHSTLRKMRTAF